jgi:hypothetical protein
MAKTHMPSIVQGFLKAQGIPSTVKTGHPHTKVRFEVAGQMRTYVCAGTVSDRRAPLNAIADLRRLLRQAGHPGASAKS